MGSAAYDADNYDCNSNGCVYTGCNNNSECDQLVSGYTCQDPGGLGYAYCAAPCSTPSDCGGGGGAAYDADNYNCVSNECLYTGCNSDNECQTTPSMGSDWECFGL